MSESVRCAAWTKATDPDPCGSASEHETILAIDLPAPWPSDVGEISEPWSRLDPPVRALAVPPTDADGGPYGQITAWRRAPGGNLVGTDYTLAPGRS